MKKIYTVLAVFSIFLINLSYAQDITYSKVKIWLGEKTIQELQEVGVATDHGSYKKDTWFQTTLADFEIAELEEAGFDTEIIIEDMQTFYVERNESGITKGTHGTHAGGDCGGGIEYAEVENFELGSMGGFFTYQEMLDNLDSMQAMYPNLISFRDGISTFETHEGRPIYWVRISNNPTVEDATKPEILYTAIHHAREPASMSQLIYYMWYVLENYDTNLDVKYVVDNT
ncbi:MAG: M14 family zinc carboxypeptidase, partial [Chitinophagales bacterium]